MQKGGDINLIGQFGVGFYRWDAPCSVPRSAAPSRSTAIGMQASVIDSTEQHHHHMPHLMCMPRACSVYLVADWVEVVTKHNDDK
jgi:hypothetical protein